MKINLESTNVFFLNALSRHWFLRRLISDYVCNFVYHGFIFNKIGLGGGGPCFSKNIVYFLLDENNVP
jgi:hypothetical protein